METRRATIFTVEIIALLIATCSIWGLPGQAIDLKQLKLYSDSSMPATERLRGLVGLLEEEVQSPTESHIGWGGGKIDHDYTMTQIALGISHVAKETSEARHWLKSKLKESNSTEAEEVLKIALGLARDPSVATCLAELLKRPGNPNRRALAAFAIGESGSVVHIPDLLNALNDAYSFEHFGDVGEAETAIFPVRRAAYLALRRLNVKVLKPNPDDEFKYEVDRASAIKAIVPALQSPDNTMASSAIRAIGRVGGSNACEALQNYIELNRENPDKKELVIQATAAQSCIP